MTALHWLAATALMTGLLWVPYVLERMVSLGVMGALRPVDPEDLQRQAVWAQRAKRAHYNAVENLAVFGVLMVAATSMNLGDDPQVLLATQIYFVSRLVHFPAAAFGIPVVRTLAFLGGFTGQVLVFLSVFGTGVVA